VVLVSAGQAAGGGPAPGGGPATNGGQATSGGQAPAAGTRAAGGHAPGAHWQREELVTSFTERRHILIPMLDVQEDVVRKLLQRHERPVARFLDIGSGAGAMSELVLANAREVGIDAQGVLVDFSEPMLARAGGVLADHPGRWQLVRGDLSRSSWQQALPDERPFDAVVSSLAIHHLPAQRKRELFAEVLELLAPGGLFINLDYVLVAGPLRGLFDEQQLANALQAERDSGGTRHEHEVELDDDDDRPDTVEHQLRWLHEAGFADVEVHFKWAEAAVFGGARPR
jgi:SAM-dependent methyltransferase